MAKTGNPGDRRNGETRKRGIGETRKLGDGGIQKSGCRRNRKTGIWENGESRKTRRNQETGETGKRENKETGNVGKPGNKESRNGGNGESRRSGERGNDKTGKRGKEDPFKSGIEESFKQGIQESWNSPFRKGDPENQGGAEFGKRKKTKTKREDRESEKWRIQKTRKQRNPDTSMTEDPTKCDQLVKLMPFSCYLCDVKRIWGHQQIILPGVAQRDSRIQGSATLEADRATFRRARHL